MLTKTKLRLGVVAATAVAVMAFGAVAPASADPGSFKLLNGVGSDTTQDVMNGVATVVTNIGSYDALGSAQIQTTSGGPSFNRPNGSSNGLRALSSSINNTGTRTWPLSGGVNITGQVDFARSSSGPSVAGSELTFIPFARDAVTYAVSAASDFPRDVALGAASQDAISPAPFTLRNIYRGAVTTFADSEFNTVTIRPLVPQSGSGTRSFWLSTLGLTEAQSIATDLGGTVQEHNGTAITGAGDLVPFSIAQYIAQGNHNSLPSGAPVTERRGNIELGKIGNAKPIILNAGVVELNTSFPVSRLVYNVVSTARLTGTSTADLALQAAFVGSTSQVCAAGAQIKQYGFGTIGATCGSTTSKSGYYTS